VLVKQRSFKHTARLAAAASVAVSAIVVAAVAASPLAEAGPASFVGRFSTVSTVASTVPVLTGPGNGDVNPYGVAVVPRSQGRLVKGDVLVSNFNNAANQQGTGTTIVSVSPKGTVSVFAQISPSGLPGACPGGIGLTTALTILNGGWVVVGSLPTTAGDPATSKAGCLLVLNSSGRVVTTFSGHGINGPWDMTAVNFGRVAELFVTNVLNGTVKAALNAGVVPSQTVGPTVDGGTVLRLLVTTPAPGYGVPSLLATTEIGSGFGEHTDPNALVIGPTGVGIGRHGTLYVADSVGNRITAIPDALFRVSDDGTGRTVSAGGWLSGPLGLAIAPGGDILAANSGNGNLVEITPGGAQVADPTVTAGGAGALFGLAVAPHGSGVYFVDDSVNTLDLLH
jgi:hypothetical protein